MKRCFLIGSLCAVLMGSFSYLWGQDSLSLSRWAPEKWQKPDFSCSLQGDALLSPSVSEEGKTHLTPYAHTYLTARLRNNYLEMGVRLEELSRPLPGREEEKGWGIPMLYLTARYKNLAELTLGDFYEQFGSGAILRSYEDRALGIDNSVRGAKLVTAPIPGLRLKTLYGQQRNYFDRGLFSYHAERGTLFGQDVELSSDGLLPAMESEGWNASLGASWVTKWEAQEPVMLTREGDSYQLRLPQRVSAMGLRSSLSKGGFRGYAEYVYKINDPIFANHYSYAPGQMLMLSSSYSQKGLSILLQCKRSENFHFLSARNATGTQLRINHLPPFTETQTYALAAMYPYATQPLGEWAYQGEVRYTVPKKTWLGGKRGMNLKLAYSSVRALDSQPQLDKIVAQDPTALYGTEGVTSSFLGQGDLYYSDLHFEMAKKISKEINMVLSYMYQIYNQEAIEGHAIRGKYVHSHIFVADAQYRFSSKMSLRSECQYLHTREAEGDWLYAMAECSMAPGWMISLSDQYNVGTTKKHYYMFSGAYSYEGHRVMLGVGKTRAGINCSGGVCRFMPATQGFYLSYSLQF